MIRSGPSCFPIILSDMSIYMSNIEATQFKLITRMFFFNFMETLDIKSEIKRHQSIPHNHDNRTDIHVCITIPHNHDNRTDIHVCITMKKHQVFYMGHNVNKRPLGLTAPLSNNTLSMIYSPMNTK